MKFTKMEGLGNDYVYVNCFEEEVKDPSKVSIKVSDRHFGIGSDGLILIKPSDKADVEMAMYNADGSQAEMCGNGIRCVGKYAYDHGLVKDTEITVNTLAGIKNLSLKTENNKVVEVTVDMGEPILNPADIPVVASGDAAIRKQITIQGKNYEITCVSMGNPHAIIFVDSTKDYPIEELGPLFENHAVFPKRTNTEFVEVISRNEVNMRVWERGSGETLACGTGACATCVACVLNDKTDDEITIHLLGGDLKVKWDRYTNRVFMTGAATEVFSGEIEI